MTAYCTNTAGEMLSARGPDVSYQTLTHYLNQKRYSSTWDKLSLNSEPVSEANKLEFLLWLCMPWFEVRDLLESFSINIKVNHSLLISSNNAICFDMWLMKIGKFLLHPFRRTQTTLPLRFDFSTCAQGDDVHALSRFFGLICLWLWSFSGLKLCCH